MTDEIKGKFSTLGLGKLRSKIKHTAMLQLCSQPIVCWRLKKIHHCLVIMKVVQQRDINQPRHHEVVIKLDLVTLHVTLRNNYTWIHWQASNNAVIYTAHGHSLHWHSRNMFVFYIRFKKEQNKITVLFWRKSKSNFIDLQYMYFQLKYLKVHYVGFVITNCFVFVSLD